MNFSKSELLEILAEVNENQPEPRMLNYKTLVSAAYRAETKGETKEEIISMISDFAKAATSSISKAPSSFVSECKDLLPIGHPLSNASLAERIEWVSLDPILGESRKSLVSAASGVYGSSTENIHAWGRLLAMAKQNLLPREFISTISSLEAEVENGNS